MLARIPQLPHADKLPHDFSLALLEQIYPRELISDLLTRFDRWEQRERKLSQVMVVYLLIAWHLFLALPLSRVFLQLTSPLRLLAGLSTFVVPTEAAITYRRKQLGVRLLRSLLLSVCRPLACAQTPNAFAFGLRVMGVDGTLEDVKDTPRNAAFFGRINEGETKSPYPQARCVYMVEVATHAIIDAILAPCKADERCLSWGLLASVQAGMLLLLDRGFVSGAFLQAVHQRGAEVLARLSAGMFLRREQVLGDGSYLTTLQPGSCEGLKEPLRVRVIEYGIKEEIADELVSVTPSRVHSKSTRNNPQVRTLHRLVTTLLDPVAYPALQLCLLYHERWEVELVIDETKNHLRLSQTPLRSRLPLLVLQELYTLLLAHYAVRCVMVTVAQSQQELDPDRLSFVLAVQEVGAAVVLSSLTHADQVRCVLAALAATLLRPASLVHKRRLRFNCRVVKRTQTRFRRKQPHHRNVLFHALSFSDLLRI